MATDTGMKMARASQADIDSLWLFLQDLEAAEDRDEYWNAAHDDLIEIPEDEKGWQEADDRLLKWVRQNIDKIRGFERIVFGYQMLLENCCDPALSYLDWRPDVKAACESAGIEG